MRRAWIQLATFAAYLPSAALPVLAERSDLPGGAVDPSALVVPFCVTFAAAFPLWGRLADRVPAQRVIAAALALSALAGAAVALAPSEALLIAARALQGAAAAGVPPAAQAALAGAGAERQTGRAISPMMLAVAYAVLAGPALAAGLAASTGWTTTALLVGCALPLWLAVAIARLPAAAVFAKTPPPAPAPYADARGVHAGWVVSACVLAGHWTVLTRLAEALGSGGLHAGGGWAGLAPLTGAAGLPLIVLAARGSDRVGPRAPMVAALASGAVGFGLAAAASDALVFVAAAGVGLAAYWAYLPVVAAQVQRSAGSAARGRAAGGLYSSMWFAAALAGALASFAPSWRFVLGGAAISWAAGALVARRRFIAQPATEARAAAVPAATAA